MPSPLIINNDPSILMEDRIVNTTDTVDTSIFNRIEEGDDTDHHFANATAQCSKLKHIDCRQEWVKTLRNKNVCNTVHIPTKDNLADIFTKILPGGDFIRLRDQLLHPTHTN